MAILLKISVKMILGLVNLFGKTYLNYQSGLEARIWLENHVINKMTQWSRKTQNIADDGCVAFIRGVLKSGRITDNVK